MQAYVPVEIIWNWAQKKYKPRKYKLAVEYLIRSGLVLFTCEYLEGILRRRNRDLNA